MATCLHPGDSRFGRAGKRCLTVLPTEKLSFFLCRYSVTSEEACPLSPGCTVSFHGGLIGLYFIRWTVSAVVVIYFVVQIAAAFPSSFSRVSITL